MDTEIEEAVEKGSLWVAQEQILGGKGLFWSLYSVQVWLLGNFRGER